jgi:hypothetical protein
MAELSTSDRTALAQMTGDMMTLLQLDDAWTEWTELAPQRVALDPAFFPVALTEQMTGLLRRMGGAADFIGSLPKRMGDDLQERFDALQWGEGLSTADRDDLRWLVTRAGGVTGLVQSTAAALSNYEAEIEALQQQVQRVQSGGTAAGDLSRKFRCALGNGLMIGGASSLPAAAMAGAGAALATGGVVAVGVIVGATGGVGAIALVVVGLLVIRRQKC